ncbi:MAG: ribosome biogenesis GTPase Der [Verrucomicrobia bacterium]|nr:ribosome biogenesis GTPase Der [Verrucomicrobiota bacterium]
MAGVIAIVGRPNVGKSALFNRIVGRRIAIVHDQPGVTRDRISAEAEWRGRPFTLVDTGGLGLVRGEKTSDALLTAAVAQVEAAIEAADVILLVVDVQEGLVPLDQEVAQRLRQAGKPVILAVNKVDHDGAEAGLVDFGRLGFERLLPVSAIHGRGVAQLMHAAMALLPAAPLAPELPTKGPGPGSVAGAGAMGEPLKLAIVGRPNVGKSSLINALTRADRVIVSPIPGTTRDAVDVPFEVETDGMRQRYLLIDTAGIRKPRRVGDSIEFFSVKRAEDSIARCDLAVFVLDAESGILEQDKKIADRIVAARKACVLVVNKWDLFEEAVRRAQPAPASRGRPARGRGRAEQPLTGLGQFGRWVQEQLFFLDYAPVIFTSASTGFHLDRLLETVRFVAAQLRQHIPTALLNRTLHDAVERRQPISASGTRLRFFYATQTRQAPPTFLLFVNRHELFSEAYTKYLAGELRRAFGFEGCPLVLVPKARPKTIAPKRHRAVRRGPSGQRQRRDPWP